jgi:hypothetical protein
MDDPSMPAESQEQNMYVPPCGAVYGRLARNMTSQTMLPVKGHEAVPFARYAYRQASPDRMTLTAPIAKVARARKELKPDDSPHAAPPAARRSPNKARHKTSTLSAVMMDAIGQGQLIRAPTSGCLLLTDTVRG